MTNDLIKRAIEAVKIDPQFCRMAEDAGAGDVFFERVAEAAVRATVEAMREPTASMRVAALNCDGAQETWEAMIDAALATPSSDGTNP